jgi:hypothetical protein
MQLLNSNITTEEVLKAAKSLKNGKAGGPDGILNEMLKISFIYSTTAYVNLFNTILKSFTLSNAFLKSIKQTYRHFDTLKALSIRHFKVNM